jgi:hypothetical protein
MPQQATSALDAVPGSRPASRPALRGGPRLPRLVQVHMRPSNRASRGLHAPSSTAHGELLSPHRLITLWLGLGYSPWSVPLPRLPLCETVALSLSNLTFSSH